MTSSEDRVACTWCGQDYQQWYRVLADGRTFLLYPECDAVWLSELDRRHPPAQFLPDLFSGDHLYDAWDLIERADPPDAERP